MTRIPLLAAVAAVVLACADPAGAAAGRAVAAPPPPAPGALLAPGAGTARYAVGEVLVRFRDDVRSSQRAAALAAVRASTLGSYPLAGVERLRIEGASVEEAVARLSADPGVRYAEPNWVLSVARAPNDPLYPEQWPLRNRGQTAGTPGADIRAEYAWDVTTGDSTVVVGVIDSGLDLSHPDLAGNVWTNPGEIPGNGQDDDGDGFVDDVHGWDFANGDADPTDDNGHGTHVSGIIAAVGDNDYGVAGVCWRVKIMPLKFIAANGAGLVSSALAAIQFASDHHVRITNNSWGGGPFSQSLEDGIAAAGRAGMLLVVAAGNAGADLEGGVFYPASYPAPEILTVGATNKNDSLAVFSNYGIETVDLAAPGEAVLSLWPANRFAVLSGTSMAAPHVSGAAALLAGLHPGWSPLQLKDRLMRAAVPLPTLAGRCVTGARLDLLRAIAEPDSVPPGRVADAAVTGSGSNSLDLAWTATGDDGGTGTAFRYDVRVAAAPLDSASFASATRVPVGVPGPAGTPEHARVRGLAPRTTYWVALRAEDEFGNPGPLSNVVSGTTLDPPRLAVSGPVLAAALRTGESLEQVVTITNDSPGTLDWRVPPAALAAPAMPAGATPAAVAARARAKGVEGPRAAARASGSGGPDAFGYRWFDSGEPGGPAFDWVDIERPENQLDLVGDDAVADPVPLGFAFPFYGDPFTQVRVCTNGFLAFEPGEPAYANVALPSSLAPGRIVAALWDDLTFGFSARRAYTWSDGARFVVTWAGVPRWGEPLSSLTFQAVLLPGGEIRLQYRALSGDLSSCTVGLQDGSRSMGLTVASDQPYLRDSLAIRLQPLPRWVSSSPDSGSLGPRESAELRVRFDASRLASGALASALHVLSNDPVTPDSALPVTLEVTGRPVARLHTNAVAFGDVQAGRRGARSVLVENAGGAPLTLTGAVAPPPFAVALAPHALAPGDFESIAVDYEPAVPGEDAGRLAIATDDSEHASLEVALSGRAVPPPALALGTPSLRLDAANGLGPAARDREERLVVRNPGASPLHWTAEALQAAPAPAAPARRAAVKGGPEPAGVIGPRGPDAAGYRWIDSDAPGGPAFAWEEISEVGARLFGGADDSTRTAVPLPFAFPFYGDTFTTVNVCTNGWLSFRDAGTAFLNGDLPDTSAATPRALVAPWWDDLDLRPVGGGAAAYAWYDGAKLVIEWRDAAHFAVGGPYTFEAMLWPDGAIDFQYLSMNGATDQATAGLQGGDGTTGLRVVWNAPWVHDRLRVRLAQRPPWLDVDRHAGVTPPGGADTLIVRATADGWPDGLREGAVRLTSDDPARGQVDVPVTLHVGAAAAAGTLSPGRLGAVSRAPLVGLDVALPPGYGGWDPATVTLGGVPARTDLAGAPAPGHSLAWFDAVALRSRLAAGSGVAMPFAGLAAGGWLADTVHADVEGEGFAAGPLPAFGAAPTTVRAGTPVGLEWSPPAGTERTEVAQSLDGGRTWASLATTAESAWPYAPLDASDAAMVELVALRADAVLASWLSAPFTVVRRDLPDVGPDAPPAAFSLRALAASPGRPPVRLLWGVPVAAPGRVSVLDVRGARVRTLFEGALEPGIRTIAWDGRAASGTAVPPGVYFVRAEAAGRALTRRVVLLR